MTAAPSPWRLRVHETLPSTAGLVGALALAGEPEGLAVLARRQSAGRGTAGRIWASPAGNLALSVLLRPRGPVREAPQWALLAAVALAEATLPYLPGPAPLRLKWPNDLTLNGAKFAGILVECEADADGGITWLSLGFGANLAVAPELPDRTAACLATFAPPPAPEVLAAALLAALDRWRRRRLLEGFAPVRAAWLALGPALGTHLLVRRPGGTIAGGFAGLADDGSLLLATGGRVHAVVVGEVTG